MFRIGEFSKLTQVSVRMLRYYDEAGLLKPEKTDALTGYRLYSVDQIPLLNKIIFLRDTGFQVAEIADILKHWREDYILLELARKSEEIEKTIEAQRNKLDKIKLAQKDMAEEKSDMHYKVSTKYVPSYQVLSLRKVIPDYFCEGELWEEMREFACENHINVSEETFSIYHDIEYKERDVDVELCAPVDKAGKNIKGFTYRYTEPVPVMAYTMVYGEFKNIAGAYRSFAGWLGHNGQYSMTGQSRQIVHRGPWNEPDAQRYLTEIQIPVGKR